MGQRFAAEYLPQDALRRAQEIHLREEVEAGG